VPSHFLRRSLSSLVKRIQSRLIFQHTNGSRTVATLLTCPNCFNCASSKSKTSNGTLLSIPSDVPKV
jgi:hypothetical protein